MLTVLLSGRQTTTKATKQLRDINGRNRREKAAKNILHCYLNSNPTEKEYTRMIDIWTEYARFNTSQKPADQE